MGQRVYYASMSGVCSSYELIRPFEVSMLPVFAYCSNVFTNGTGAQQKIVARIIEVELSILFFGAFLRAVCIGSV